MKTTKKVLVCCLCVAAIVSVSILGTLAYLTDTDSAVNTFTVGKVEIALNEAKVNSDGTPVKDENGDPVDRVKENTYHLIPGQTYVKDPSVTVKAGSEESYIRMLVTINCYDVLQTIYNGEFLPQNFVEGWDGSVWVSTKEVKVSDDGKSATYEFRYHRMVDGYREVEGADGIQIATADEMLPALFTAFTVPGAIDGDDLQAISGLTITVEGHAIQAAGFAEELDAAGNVVKTAEEAAWAAFDDQV